MQIKQYTGNGQSSYMFKQHVVEESSLHSGKLHNASFGVLVGL